MPKDSTRPDNGVRIEIDDGGVGWLETTSTSSSQPDERHVDAVAGERCRTAR